MRPRKSLLFLVLLSTILFQRSDPFRERSPAVAINRVFAAATDGSVFALEATTGRGLVEAVRPPALCGGSMSERFH